MTTVRRAAAALAATAVLCTAGAGIAAPAASAAPSPAPSPVIPSGLYGVNDPTYDGVWRQSLAFIAQHSVGIKPAQVSVDWLMGQQCESGAFTSYRPDPAKNCDPATMLDTNATAVALQALSGTERPKVAEGGATDAVTQAVKSASGWLKSAQNPDGGWGYNPGSPSDANSTSIVIGALAASGEKPGAVKSTTGRTPYDALLTFALPCSDKAGPGAFAYQPDKSGKLFANADATAAAALAGLGKGILAGNVQPQQNPSCEDKTPQTIDRAALNGASYLAAALEKTGHLLSPPMPGATDPAEQPDFGNTADAVVALGASGHTQQATGALTWLEKNAPAWAKTNGPAAYAQLIFAAKAMGADPHKFGGTDLVEGLNATGPAPQGPETTGNHAEDEGSFNIWWIIGIGTVVGVGIGFLLSGRKK
ncbi:MULTISPECIES: prenyltransferase/squalene oxidase repeat-containing protein [Streptomyces]|uniref:Prenyltransferase/squalene oxidase repeat-containing protein n=1 Tax=Streptomyces solicathayae TaxID=3081768 RepID=A0ABZ0LYP1_9ACTN|nr:prenyltransferase/squalene oxidase repeat-containing protein [Streptomyces sp. HUAS YS2]WOX24623.1 prenyltransferase/squalene oxidase repeat-containing protein [Streptomyces sp. HUAS YS2]